MPTPDESVDYYRVLDVKTSATAAEIKYAYHAAAKRAHPDAGGSHDAMERVNRAYQVLSDPVRRRYYDDERTHPREVDHDRTEPGRATHRQPESHPSPAATAQARADFRKLRRAQARGVALQMLLRSVGAALILEVVGRLLVSATSSSAVAGQNSADKAISVAVFIPVYFVALSLVFLFDPDLRLELFDLTHRAGLRSKLELLRLLTFLALPFFPLAILWAWLLPL
jgi:hypothetical protein